MALQDYHNTGDTASDISIRADSWSSMTFTAGCDYCITSVKVKLFKGVKADGLPEGNPGTVTVSICSVNDDNEPDEVLTSGTTDGDTLPTGWAAGYEWREIDLTSYLLAGDTTYAILIQALSGNNTNYIHWRLDKTEGYPDGNRVYTLNAGGTWYQSDYDMMFETWGELPPVYKAGDVIMGTDGNFYEALVDHTASVDSTPITGDDWKDYWRLAAMVAQTMVWLSETGDYEDFEAGVNDADSFSISIPTTDKIMWIESLNDLLVGTGGDEWIIETPFDVSITPTNHNIRQQSSYGSAAIQPVKANEEILFVDLVRRKLRALIYSKKIQKYIPVDLTVLAEHITSSGIVGIAHQRNPDSILWCWLKDGSLISVTYEPEQNVIAWATHPIDGIVQSVCVIPKADEDEIWLSIQRTINEADVVYIEKMMPRNFGTDLEDAFFVDCGITYEGAPTSTISGLGHLEGKTVKVLGDGVVFDDAVVASGQITTKLNGITTKVSKAQVGLGSQYKLEPMKPIVGEGISSSTASIVSVKEMGISLLNSAGVKYGASDSALYDIDLDDARWKNTSEIDGCFTGTVAVAIDSGYSLEAPLIISGDSPLPCCVRALIPKLEKTGR